MREKELKLIVTFHTTTSAMAMEATCSAKNVPGRLIPVPREISSSCGMSWCSPLESRSIIEKIVDDFQIDTDSYYEILV